VILPQDIIFNILIFIVLPDVYKSSIDWCGLHFYSLAANLHQHCQYFL